jgi:predicted O-methyltransferase YrrM
MRLPGRGFYWLVMHRLGLWPADTQVTAEERRCLVDYVAGRRSIVEIGVYHGATTALLARAMAPNGILYGIDPHPPGRLGFSLERAIARREIARAGARRVVLIQARSDQAARGWRQPIDFLFIDGDHSWEGLARDWRDWSPHVVPGGVVALHDSRPSGHEEHGSVRYAREHIFPDPRFRQRAAVGVLTVLERVG